MKSEFEPIATRINQARIEFVQNIMEQFGKTESEAHKVLDVFIKNKAVKLNVAMGRYELKHGAYWELAVIDNALTLF